MTKRDLFKIILKLYGLYSIIEVIIQIPNISFYLYYDSGNEFNWLVLTVPLVSILIIFVLLFKPEIIIGLFKLDKGFENNEVPITSFDGRGIAKIALIIIAVYLIVINIGDFISQVVFSFKESVSRNSLDSLLETFNPNPVNYQVMINSAICLLVGFILLTNHTRLSKWIEKINNKNDI
ncbi:MAG: hypothetical protein V4622_01165 [Bacteroidota bacterium]